MSEIAYKWALKTTGASTVFANAATTDAGDHKVFQITESAKRIIDPAVAVGVEVDADGGGGGGYVPAAVGTYRINPLGGIVTFANPLAAGALVRVTGAYLPTRTLANFRTFKGSFQRTIVDRTVIDPAGDGWRRYAPGICGASGELGGLDFGLEDLDDVAAGVQSLWDKINAGSALVLEWAPPSGAAKLRAFALLESLESSAEIDDLAEGVFAWQSVATPITGQPAADAVGASWAP